METLTRLVDEARAALDLHHPANLDIQRAFTLAKDLSDHGLFDYAAAVIDTARQRQDPASSQWQRLSQRLALYTYKDTALPILERLATALAILEESGLSTTRDQETLGLAAAIYRRRWELSGKRSELEQSLEYYVQGYRQGIDADDGYNAINAAYVLDLLAHEMNPGAMSAEQSQLRERARTIRGEIVTALTARLTPDQALQTNLWWVAATLIEAYIGRGDCDGAAPWLNAARSIKAPPWQRESTLRQLVAMVRVCGITPDQQAACNALLAEYFPHEFEAIRLGPPGRLGLALSGGGLRASLYHLGVLAKLAELDLLRHVEVLSCVSGGSIVGVNYYLALRVLLQSKPDAEISRDDYVKLLHEIIRVFRAGCGANVRMLSLSSFRANFRILFDPLYSRSDRIAELYDQYFYNAVAGNEPGRRILLRDIDILPKGQDGDAFVANRDNWERRNKVPALLLNATALNTGNSWEFTPAAMGESGSAPQRGNGTYRFRKMYFQHAPEIHRDLPLSCAVAASSCAPGLFPPFSFVSLYPGKMVALVDGGLHDNQGVTGLLSEDCRVLLMSDAGGQVAEVDHPSLGYLGVIRRAISLLRVRLRDVQHRELDAMQRSGVMQLVTFPLKQETLGSVIDWEGCNIRPLGYAPPAPVTAMDSGGILKEVQELLALIRTDLDAFSDLESLALMYAGYEITGQYISTLNWVKPRDDQAPPAWAFLGVKKMMTGEDPAGSRRLIQHLRAGAKRGGKWLQLSRSARRIGLLSSLIFLAVVVLTLVMNRWFYLEHLVLRTLEGLGLFYGALLVTALGVQYVRRAKIKTDNKPALTQIIVDMLVLTLIWLPAKIDVALIRPAYLKLGRVDEEDS